jgi:hypothetical protein
MGFQGLRLFSRYDHSEISFKYVTTSIVNRCWGLTKNFNRCGRKGDWRLFCEEHQKQPLGWIIFLIFSVEAGSLTILDHIPYHSPLARNLKNSISLPGREIRMDKTGQDLELLVAGIEKQLLPKGFKVEPRQRVLNDNGEQVAELDIVISGPLGSSTVKWLLECRDRPSEGSAPVSWIEQLVARRERLGFDKVFAVSTTGFSKAAAQYAKSKGIVLRTVTRLTDIKDDFMLQGMMFNFEEVEFSGEGQLETDDPTDRRHVDLRRPMFKHPAESEFLHFPLFISRHPQTVHPMTDGSGLLLFVYDDWLDMQAGTERFRVHKIRIPFLLKRFQKESKALVAMIYSEEGKPIWLEGQFEADTPKGKVKAWVQIFTNPDGTSTAKFGYTDMPDGYFPDKIELYGRN